MVYSNFHLELGGSFGSENLIVHKKITKTEVVNSARIFIIAQK